MIRYRPIKGSDIPQIVELYAQYLNSGEYYSELIRSWWAEGAYQGYAAVQDGAMIGLMTVRRGIAFTYPHPELEAELSLVVGDQPVANCDALLVLPEHRHEGVAGKLAGKILKLLMEEDYRYFLSEVWIYPDGTVPASSVFESFGRLVWQRQIDGFYRDLERYGMSCPICGSRCVCGARIDLMEIEKTRGAEGPG